MPPDPFFLREDDVFDDDMVRLLDQAEASMARQSMPTPRQSMPVPSTGTVYPAEWLTPTSFTEHEFVPASEPVTPPAPPDEVLITQTDYRRSGMWEGRRHSRNPNYIRILRSTAMRYSAVQFYELAADLPPVELCNVCGVMLSADPSREGPLCDTCGPRAAATLSAIAEGGRQFGIELEFSLPTGERADYSDYDDEDYDDSDENCNCEECVRERGGPAPTRSRPTSTSMEGIANAIHAAGVPCTAPGYTHAIWPGQWKLVPDSSVRNGYELVSPPLQWAQADQVRTVCQVLHDMGCRPTRDCGLHVHHDVGDICVETARMLARNWNTCQGHSNMLVDSSRIGCDWCFEPTPNTVRNMCNFEGDRLHEFLELDYERYRPLNWTCFNSYGTVEVRMHESTLDADEILAWCAYTQSIVEASLDRRELPQPDDISDTLNQLTIRRAAGPMRVRRKLLEKAERGSASAIEQRRRRAAERADRYGG